MARRGIVFRQKGDFGDVKDFLEKMRKSNRRILAILKKFGNDGVISLAYATPKRTGKTSRSWSYKIEQSKGSYALSFQNDNLFNGVPIVALIVYGHATPSGKWVEGRDFVTPVTEPMFEKLQDEIRKEVMKW